MPLMAVVLDNDVDGVEIKSLVNIETRQEFENPHLNNFFFKMGDAYENEYHVMSFIWHELPTELIEKIVVNLAFRYYLEGSFNKLGKLLIYFARVSQKISQYLFRGYYEDERSESTEIKCLYLVKFLFNLSAIIKDEYEPVHEYDDYLFKIPPKMGQIKISSKCKDESPMRKYNYLFNNELSFDGFDEEEISDTTTRTYFCLDEQAFDTSYLLYHNPRLHGEPAILDVNLVLNPCFCFNYRVHSEIFIGDEIMTNYRNVEFDEICQDDWEILTRTLMDLFGQNTGVIVNDFIRIQI